MALADLLDIRPGVTAVIGGGGKTTLAADIGGGVGGGRQACAAVHHYENPALSRVCPVPGREAELEELWQHHRLLCAGTIGAWHGEADRAGVSHEPA